MYSCSSVILRATERYGVRNELGCLVTENFMPRSAAELVNIQQAETFFGGRLYAEIKKARRFVARNQIQMSNCPHLNLQPMPD